MCLHKDKVFTVHMLCRVAYGCGWTENEPVLRVYINPLLLFVLYALRLWTEQRHKVISYVRVTPFSQINLKN